MSVDGSSSTPAGSPSPSVRRHAKTPSTASFYPTHATRASYSVPKSQSQFAAPFKPLSEQETIQDRAEAVSSALEDAVDSYSHPIKPWLPAIGRFLIVVTFVEDALRMLTQWSDQKYYLRRHRNFYYGTAQLFLLFNILTMLACSGMVMAKRYPEASIAGLLAVVVIQGFGYGLIFDLNFFLRNLSVVGGLLMVLSEALSKRKDIFAGIPNVNEEDRKTYFQLAGRVLLVFIFLGFVFHGGFNFLHVMVSLIGLVACVMVAVGYKAKLAASTLVVVLSLVNVFANSFWTMPSAHPQRDFLRYDFFQTLSIVGGLIMLVNLGAGSFSMDSKKRM